MGARSTHNRACDNDFFSKDVNVTIRKAKRHNKAYGEFYIRSIKNSDGSLTYYADISNFNNLPARHFVNIAPYGERAKWIEKEEEK